MVENPTDEDWHEVTMALVSGRPISFKMDLYNPLYVARPTVEPELFASLRPPTYGGALAGKPGMSPAGGDGTRCPAPARGGLRFGRRRGHAGRRDEGRQESAAADRANRLYADEVAKKLREDLDVGRSVQTVATASSLGDYYQYVIDRPVDLARQKSALLPIVNKDVEGKRVSIYNPAVQPKHPLLGLRFKNTTGMPLTQGPITVFEGSVYAGDTRVLDLQPDEERLVSYAIDLGTEVSAKTGQQHGPHHQREGRQGDRHDAHGRPRGAGVRRVQPLAPRTARCLIEHPNRKGQGFAFIGENKPKEEAADVYRFEVPVAAKKDLTYTVIEERPVDASVHLTNNADDQIRYFINLKEAPPALKAKLQEALKVKAGVGQGPAGHPGGERPASRRSRPTRSGCGRTCGRRPRRARCSSGT